MSHGHKALVRRRWILSTAPYIRHQPLNRICASMVGEYVEEINSDAAHPVTQRASSLAKKTATGAISSGVPSPLKGCRPAAIAFVAGSSKVSAVKADCTHPGHIAFTCTPIGAQSCAAALVMPMTACFDVAYETFTICQHSTFNHAAVSNSYRSSEKPPSQRQKPDSRSSHGLQTGTALASPSEQQQL